jgi:pyruvate kinase
MLDSVAYSAGERLTMSDPQLLVTLGPSSLSKDFVSNATKIGATLFRINLSHTRLEDVEGLIKTIQDWTDVPVCLDSEGAQLRNQAMEGGEVSFQAGDKVRISYEAVKGDRQNLSFTPIGMATRFEPGDSLRIDFDGAEFEITGKSAGHCTAVAVKNGVVGSNKAADIDRDLPFQPLTSKDLDAIEIGLNNGIRNFALSFCSRRDDVHQMRAACGQDANIICKVENRESLRNLSEIMEEADAILIDRGDLSRQIDIHRIPVFQKQIISRANAHPLPVFVATNLLESMTSKGTPTRAEVNDVVSSLLMGADGLVLAAETAIGEHPLEAVRMIRLLIDEAKNWNPELSLEDLLGQ